MNYEGGYSFNQGVAFGQLNQVLDLAAQQKNPDKIKALLKTAEVWLDVINKLDVEQEKQPQPLGFYIVEQDPLETESEEDDEQSEE